MDNECSGKGRPEVRVLHLEPLTVASAYGFGKNPEQQAWDKLLSWASKVGLSASGSRFFGFNNPAPSLGSPNYGYEQWMTVDPSTEGDSEVTIKQFPGGLYAVLRCRLMEIGQAWQDLVLWCEDSRYKITGARCLEESITPCGVPEDQVIMDLYQPIVE